MKQSFVENQFHKLNSSFAKEYYAFNSRITQLKLKICNLRRVKSLNNVLLMLCLTALVSGCSTKGDYLLSNRLAHYEVREEIENRDYCKNLEEKFKFLFTLSDSKNSFKIKFNNAIVSVDRFVEKIIYCDYKNDFDSQRLLNEIGRNEIKKSLSKHLIDQLTSYKRNDLNGEIQIMHDESSIKRLLGMSLVSINSRIQVYNENLMVSGQAPLLNLIAFPFRLGLRLMKDNNLEREQNIESLAQNMNNSFNQSVREVQQQYDKVKDKIALSIKENENEKEWAKARANLYSKVLEVPMGKRAYSKCIRDVKIDRRIDAITKLSIMMGRDDIGFAANDIEKGKDELCKCWSTLLVSRNDISIKSKLQMADSMSRDSEITPLDKFLGKNDFEGDLNSLILLESASACGYKEDSNAMAAAKALMMPAITEMGW